MCQSSARRLSIFMLSAAAALLSGCGASRDSALAEKLARAEQAAERAEAAQKAAESAANAANAKLEQISAAGEASTVPVEDAAPAERVDTANSDILPQEPA